MVGLVAPSWLMTVVDPTANPNNPTRLVVEFVLCFGILAHIMMSLALRQFWSRYQNHDPISQFILMCQFTKWLVNNSGSGASADVTSAAEKRAIGDELWVIAPFRLWLESLRADLDLAGNHMLLPCLQAMWDMIANSQEK